MKETTRAFNSAFSKIVAYFSNNLLMRSSAAILAVYVTIFIDYWLFYAALIILGSYNASSHLKERVASLQKSFGSLSITIMHVITLWGAYQAATHLVAESIGLPASDFVATHSAVILITYIPFGLTLVLLSCFFSSIPDEEVSYKAVAESILKAVPIGMMAFYLFISIVSNLISIPGFAKDNIKLLAYSFDYRTYPSLDYVEPNEKIVLHANGRISIATKSETGLVSISTRKAD